MMEELKAASLDAFEHKHYIQSAVIIFQTVEWLLRIMISATARSKDIDKDIQKKIAEKETSFDRLVLYLNLLDPANELLEKLRSFNKTRNNIMHKLFLKFEDTAEYEKTLQDFCMEGVHLNKQLRKMMGVSQRKEKRGRFYLNKKNGDAGGK